MLEVVAIIHLADVAADRFWGGVMLVTLNVVGSDALDGVNDRKDDEESVNHRVDKYSAYFATTHHLNRTLFQPD